MSRLCVPRTGSAPLLIAQGLTESLAGRFETLRLPQPQASVSCSTGVTEGGRWISSSAPATGRAPVAHSGTAAFAAAFKVRHTLLVGGDGISVADFLGRSVSEWIA